MHLKLVSLITVGMAQLPAARKVAPTSEQTSKCAWLTKVPGQNPHDTSLDCCMHMKALLNCLTLLWCNPSLAVTCQHWLEERVGGEASRPVDSDEVFETPPETVSQLPVEWLCSHLIDMAVGWTEPLLGLIKAYDKGQLYSLLCGYLNVSPRLKLGPLARDKVVLKHVFDQRRKSTPERFADIFDVATAASHVDDVGQVDFGKCGMYFFACGL